jgi:teichuronic acid biosynthesis glycosyltransferase TuaC
MKILFICSGNSVMGISPLIKAQGDSLEQLGHRIDYFKIEGKGISGYLISTLLLRRHLAKHGCYDLIHAHYSLSGIVARIATLKSKLIVSYMGSDLIGSVGKSGKKALPKKLISSISVWFAKYNDYSIVKSKNLFKKLSNLQNVAIIPNGVNTKIFRELKKSSSRAVLHWDMKTKYAIFMADPDRIEKNFKLAQDTIADICDPNLILKAVFNEPQDKMVHYYAAADLLIMTSDYEGSPNVIKEALQCNCPIVTTDVGDVREIIDDTEGCYVANNKRPDLIKAIKMALHYSAANDRTQGFKRIEIMGIDSESTAKNINRIYEMVLGRAI